MPRRKERNRSVAPGQRVMRAQLRSMPESSDSTESGLSYWELASEVAQPAACLVAIPRRGARLSAPLLSRRARAARATNPLYACEHEAHVVHRRRGPRAAFLP